MNDELTLQRVRLTVHGMGESARTRSVLGALRAIRGVVEVEVIDGGVVHLVHEVGAVTIEQLRRAVGSVGCTMQTHVLEACWDVPGRVARRGPAAVPALVVSPSSGQERTAT